MLSKNEDQYEEDLKKKDEEREKDYFCAHQHPFLLGVTTTTCVIRQLFLYRVHHFSVLEKDERIIIIMKKREEKKMNEYNDTT